MTALSPGTQVEIFYDGECPLCMREANRLRMTGRCAPDRACPVPNN